jgi:hypothetical protein
MSDEQIGNAIGTWKDENAQPKEVPGRNKFNYADVHCIPAFFRKVDNQWVVTAIDNPDSVRWITGYIEACNGDVIRTSYDSGLNVAFQIAFYNDKYEILDVITPVYATDRNGIEITIEETAFVRFEYNNATIGTHANRANSKVCITINDINTTYEDYHTELVGGIGSFMALQSPNGTKYTLDITDDGMIVGKDNDGNIVNPIDDTLTQSGKMADAKAVGDKFNTIEYQIGDINLLETVNKGSLVDAINEIMQKNLVTVSMENASVETDEDGNNVVVTGGVTV